MPKVGASCHPPFFVLRKASLNGATAKSRSYHSLFFTMLHVYLA